MGTAQQQARCCKGSVGLAVLETQQNLKLFAIFYKYKQQKIRNYVQYRSSWGAISARLGSLFYGIGYRTVSRTQIPHLGNEALWVLIYRTQGQIQSPVESPVASFCDLLKRVPMRCQA